MWEYTDKVKDHFFNPHNVGEIENPDGVGEVGSLACGDALKLTFKLDKNGRMCKRNRNVVGINRYDKRADAGRGRENH
jgi:hypothetical protein